MVKLDPWLSPFQDSLKRRYAKTHDWVKTINETEGGLEKFSKGTDIFGFNVKNDNTIVYREWAPNAIQASLIGEFSKSFSSPSFQRISANMPRQLG